MAEHPHLLLPRAEVNIERRRRPGFAGRPVREPREQADRITQAVEGVLQRRAQSAIRVIPGLVIRVRTSGVLPEEEWERAGLTVLGTDADTSVVLFSNDAELQEFRRRLREYSQGTPEGQVNPRYASLMNAIEELGPLRAEDRLGPILRREGLNPQNFVPERVYVVDVELWDIGTQQERVVRVNEITAIIEGRGGRILDRYVGRTLTLFRVSADGRLVQAILDMEDVASVDVPPEPENLTAELLDLGIEDFGDPVALPADAPSIGVLDTGVTARHPLLAPAVGLAIGVPDRLRADDVHGHGTRVASVAVYGDVRQCATARRFAPEVRVHCAKIVNDAGRFDDEKLVPSQVRTAITELARAGCRVFNISLCDPRMVYAGDKVTSWAAILDEVAREFDIVIVVSAGNYRIPAGAAEEHFQSYPRYLVTPNVRILEPATAVIPLTVGALAESAAVPARADLNVGLQPVAREGEPAPFTRSGPGVNDVLKPELCEFGGNLLFDGAAQSFSRYDECAVVTLNNEYLRRLFSTAVGTSLAAPRVAHKAALVWQRFADGSANLVRALLASSAAIPVAAEERLLQIGADAPPRVCGYGVPDVTLATTSDDSRVVLYADDSIGLDRFFVYEIPVPEEFVNTAGERYIQVTLAFDPPTRHTRVDYMGTRMSFRLVRGATLDEVVEHYRRRAEDEGPIPEMPDRYNCALSPGPNFRDRGTLQRAKFTMRQNPRGDYGETYLLVVRCERRWSGDEDAPQRFAVVVELGHARVDQLYARIRDRVRVRVRV